VVLGSHVAKAVQCQGLEVVELGAGCGLLGILCGHLGARVTLTDMASVLPVTQHNVAQNALRDNHKGSLKVEELHWGQPSTMARGAFHLILGSDVTYFEHLHEPLLCSLLQLADHNTEVLLAHAQRHGQFDRWFELFERYFEITLALDYQAAEKLISNVTSSFVGESAGERAPISVHSLRLREGLCHANLERLPPADDSSTEALLRRLSLLESDLATIEAEG